MSDKKLKITILAENCVQQEDLLAEHGLSFLLEYGNQKYLFDTGQGLAVPHNVDKLGVKLNQLDGVLISHGHYDHGGGLAKVLTEAPKIKVYGHSDVFLPKYSRYQSGPTFRGLELNKEDLAVFDAVDEPTEITAGLWMTGEIPRLNQEGTSSDKYQVKIDGEFKQDKFRDDQAAFVETNNGVVVLLACTHAGVTNTLDYIQQLTGEEITAVIGGMHLVKAEVSEINRIVDYLADLDLDLLAPLHCTGRKAVRLLAKRLPQIVEQAGVGTEFIF